MGRQSTNWLLLTSVPTMIPMLLVITSPFEVAIKVLVVGAILLLYGISNLTNRAAYKQSEPVFAKASMLTGLMISALLVGFGIVYATRMIYVTIITLPIGILFGFIMLKTGIREDKYVKRAQKNRISKLRRRKKSDTPQYSRDERIQQLKERELEVERRALERLEGTLEE